MRLSTRLCVCALAFLLAAAVGALVAVLIGLGIGYGRPGAPRWLIPYLLPTIAPAAGTWVAVAVWRRTDPARRRLS